MFSIQSKNLADPKLPFKGLIFTHKILFGKEVYETKFSKMVIMRCRLSKQMTYWVILLVSHLLDPVISNYVSSF